MAVSSSSKPSKSSVGTYKLAKHLVVVLAFITTSFHVDKSYRQASVTPTTSSDASFSSSSSSPPEEEKEDHDLLQNELHLVRLQHSESQQNQTIHFLQKRTKELELQLEEVFRRQQEEYRHKVEQQKKEQDEQQATRKQGEQQDHASKEQQQQQEHSLRIQKLSLEHNQTVQALQQHAKELELQLAAASAAAKNLDTSTTKNGNDNNAQHNNKGKVVIPTIEEQRGSWIGNTWIPPRG